MPISVPEHLLDRYGGRRDHFQRICDSLIAPAVGRAGLDSTGPSRIGTENIQAAIINDLQDADLVVADLSGLNPNVFLELGIRSALDRPVCLVSDGLDRLPFDSGTLNTHMYDPIPLYDLNTEIERMAEFIGATVARTDGRNDLWKFFGSASATLPVAELDPNDASLHAKLDRLTDLIEHQYALQHFPLPQSAPLSPDVIDMVIAEVSSAIMLAGSSGIHGSRLRNICLSVLGDSYNAFLEGESLGRRLSRLGVRFRTDESGNFFSMGSPVM